MERNLEHIDEILAPIADERLKVVLKLRFGLQPTAQRPLSLREVALHIPNKETGRLGVTRERVRQLENKALETLSAYPAHWQAFLEYLQQRGIHTDRLESRFK